MYLIITATNCSMKYYYFSFFFSFCGVGGAGGGGGEEKRGIEKPMDSCRICEDLLRTQRFKFYSGPIHQIKEIKVDRTCAGFLLPL